MPSNAALALASVVMIGILCATAAVRIRMPSVCGPLPDAVLMMSWISPFLIRSITLGRPSASLNSGLHVQPGFGQHFGRAGRGANFKFQIAEFPGNCHHVLLVRIAHADEHLSRKRQRRRGGHLRFRIGHAPIFAIPITSPVERISGPSKTRDDLSMAYTPGVARVSMAIHDDPAKAWALTIKSNTVAIISDGTAAASGSWRHRPGGRRCR